MRILVTGAGGHLGGALIDQLRCTTQHTVVAAVSPRQPSPAETDVVIDLEDAENISAVVAAGRPDAIMHLAGLVGPQCDTDAERTHRINVEATATLARAAQEAGTTRFVFASTSAVYGDHYESPIAETAGLDVSSAYAASKLAAEQVLESVAHDTFVVAALRIFNIYGPGFAGSLVTRLLESTAYSPVGLAGRSGFVRDYVHANDVCAALTAALTAQLEEPFSVVNIGSGEALSTGDVVDRLSRRATLHYTVGDERESYSAADIGLARAVLNFAPQRLS